MSEIHKSDALARIEQLSRLMITQEAEVAKLTESIEKAKAELSRTKREDLPELMRELGLAQIKLSTGETITIRDDVAARIPEEKRAAAFDWLTEHGFDGIIKTSITVNYGRGETKQAVADAEEIQRLTKHLASLEENVHPQTLRAFIRERMEAGEVVPFDLFGVHPYSEAKITR